MIARLRKPILASLTVLLGGLAVASAPANAATGYAPLCATLHTAFCANGSLKYSGLGVDQSSGASAGDLWAATGETLVKFDASGNKLSEIGEGLIVGLFGTATTHTVAVDPTSGGIYVSEYTGSGSITRVSKFSSSGALQFRFDGSETPQGKFVFRGMAVDDAGDLHIASYERNNNLTYAFIDEFDASGKYIGQLAIATPSEYQSLAVDSLGDLFIGETESNRVRVQEYGSTGVPVNCPDGSNAIYEPTVEEERERQENHFLQSSTPIAIDPSDGHIFIGEVNGEGPFIAEYATLCSAPLAKIRVGHDENGIFGIAVSGSTHDVYAASEFGTAGEIFGPVTLPDVTTGTSATGVTRSAAVVGGTVNPDGTSVTSCEVEYGTTVGYGHIAPCNQALPLEGGTPIAVSANLGFSLPPASAVYYRLKAANANGVNLGENETFVTESLPRPVVGASPPTGISQFAATLDGTLQTGEALVNYRFEYGTSAAYGAVAPIPDSYTPITNETLTVSQPVQGLQAGTTYHYRLLASSPGGTEVKGPDETFTTLAVPAPTVSTGAASAVGVGAATLSGTIDPHGWDTKYLFEYGAGTAYGQSWPTVPVEMGALEGAQPVIVNVPNLLPNTTYHYRLVAVNGGGTSYGPDLTFTTGEYAAPAIQEPPTLGTLLVPSEVGKVAPPTPKKKGKQTKKTKAKHRHPAKRARGGKRGKKKR